mgnify:CR=1 FL=1
MKPGIQPYQRAYAPGSRLQIQRHALSYGGIHPACHGQELLPSRIALHPGHGQGPAAGARQGVDHRQVAGAIAALEKQRTEGLTERERQVLEKGISNFEFHYLGSAKILGGIGKGLAEAMAELNQLKPTK